MCNGVYSPFTHVFFERTAGELGRVSDCFSQPRAHPNATLNVQECEDALQKHINYKKCNGYLSISRRVVLSFALVDRVFLQVVLQ
jgi:hypothetical protein